MTKKLILLFFLVVSTNVFATTEASDIHNQLPSTVQELANTIGSANRISSAVWLPRAELTMDLFSQPDLTKVAENKTIHVFFSNEYCTVSSDETNKYNLVRIRKNSRYIFNSFQMDENATAPSGQKVVEVTAKLFDRLEIVNTLDIKCNFPKGYLSHDSHPALIFNGGLESTIKYLPSLLL